MQINGKKFLGFQMVLKFGSSEQGQEIGAEKGGTGEDTRGGSQRLVLKGLPL